MLCEISFKMYEQVYGLINNPVDTGRKLNVHKTFRGRPGRLLNDLCTLNLRPMSTGKPVTAEEHWQPSQRSKFDLSLIDFRKRVHLRRLTLFWIPLFTWLWQKLGAVWKIYILSKCHNSSWKRSPLIWILQQSPWKM